jgi:hypothetical protein
MRICASNVDKAADLNVIETHCMIHRQMLVTTHPPSGFKQIVFSLVIREVNFVKSTTLNLGSFNNLCFKWTMQQENWRLTHTSISGGCTRTDFLKRYDLLEELKDFFYQKIMCNSQISAHPVGEGDSNRIPDRYYWTVEQTRVFLCKVTFH